MVVQRIAKIFIGRIRKDDDLLLLIAKANDVRVTSVERWLRTNSKYLTTATNLSLIAKRFSVDEKELLETEALPTVEA